MSEVFLCKTGSISAASKNGLKKAGVIVVEADNPADCQFIRSSELVSSDDMLMAAFRSLKKDFGYGDNDQKHREAFAVNMMELAEAAWTARREATS